MRRRWSEETAAEWEHRSRAAQSAAEWRPRAAALSSRWLEEAAEGAPSALPCRHPLPTSDRNPTTQQGGRRRCRLPSLRRCRLLTIGFRHKLQPPPLPPPHPRLRVLHLLQGGRGLLRRRCPPPSKPSSRTPRNHHPHRQQRPTGGSPWHCLPPCRCHCRHRLHLQQQLRGHLGLPGRARAPLLPRPQQRQQVSGAREGEGGEGLEVSLGGCSNTWPDRTRCDS